MRWRRGDESAWWCRPPGLHRRAKLASPVRAREVNASSARLCRPGGLHHMSFDNPILLLLALLPLIWAAWEWRQSSRRHALVLKAATFLCIALALAGPHLTVYQSKVAVAVLADTSASVSPDDLAKESKVAAQVEHSKGRHWTRIIP